MKPKRSQAIGLFDSGIGGLTVMKQLIENLPNEQFIYLADTARLPYGNKSPEEIIAFSIENTIRLMDKKIKLLVIACNTASAFALPKLRHLFNLPIIGVIEAGAKKAIEVSRNNKIGILGTKKTIQSGAYQTAIAKLAPKADLFMVACSLLVPLIEEGWLSHPSTRLVAREYLSSLKKEKIDTLLLGCTHYPILSSLLQEEIGIDVTLVDPASTCAKQVKNILLDNDLSSTSLAGPHQYFTSDDPEKFQLLAEKFLGNSINAVQHISCNHY